MSVRRESCEPGRERSLDASPLPGTDSREVELLALVLQRREPCSLQAGEVYTLGPGDLFSIGPEPHESWAVGE